MPKSFMCLHAAGLTLIPTSIIGYRAAANAANPADVMFCIITCLLELLPHYYWLEFVNALTSKVPHCFGLMSVIAAILIIILHGLNLIEKNFFI